MRAGKKARAAKVLQEYGADAPSGDELGCVCEDSIAVHAGEEARAVNVCSRNMGKTRLIPG